MDTPVKVRKPRKPKQPKPPVFKIVVGPVVVSFE